MPRATRNNIQTAGHKRMQSSTAELPPNKSPHGGPGPARNEPNPIPSSSTNAATRRGGSARGSTTPRGALTPGSSVIAPPGGNTTPAISRSLHPSSAVASSPPATRDIPLTSSPTPNRGLQNDGTPVPHDDARALITNPLQRKQGRSDQRQWSESPLHPPAPLTPASRIVGGRSIHRFGHSDMTRMVSETSRNVELYMWTKQPFMNGEELETVSFATRAVYFEQ
jgi:hypothetical protein